MSGKKAFIIDDERINTIILRRLLKQYKLEIDSSANPRDAVEKATYENYDIIFVNHQMEDMGGEEVVKKLISTGNKVPPVVALTSISDDLDEQSVYSYHIMCPVDFKHLNKIIKKVFEGGEVK